MPQHHLPPCPPPRARLVRVVVARARLVAHPDAVVLHGGGVALKDLRAASRARGSWSAAGDMARATQVRVGCDSVGGGRGAGALQEPAKPLLATAAIEALVAVQLLAVGCAAALSAVYWLKSGRRRCEYWPHAPRLQAWIKDACARDAVS